MVFLSEAGLRGGDYEEVPDDTFFTNHKESKDSILLFKIFIPLKIFVLHKCGFLHRERYSWGYTRSRVKGHSFFLFICLFLF